MFDLLPPLHISESDVFIKCTRRKKAGKKEEDEKRKAWSSLDFSGAFRH